MISDGKNPNLKEAAERNEQINEKSHSNGLYPYCGHDFWEEGRKLDYGDVIMCNRCCVYYVKLKHLPWIIKETKWLNPEVMGYHTNHLGGETKKSLTHHVMDVWYAAIPARVNTG